MIKVCHITSVHSWNDTRIFFKECVTLAKNGYSVSLVAPNAENQIVKNVQVIGVENQRKSRLFRATIVAFRVLRKALKTKSKIYHFHDPELIWVGLILRLFGKKVIFDVHENVKAQITDKKWLKFPKLTIGIYSLFEWLSAKLFYIVIAEDSYEGLYLGKSKSITKVLNFPVIDSLSVYRIPSNQKTENGILYVGLVSEARGIVEIIRALELLKKKNIQYTFHCIGPISEEVRIKIEQLPEYRNVKESIVFYGRLPVDQAYVYAEKSKVALSILHPVPNYIRSYSTKIFEYMAIGIPLIVSDFKLYEFVKEKEIGFLVDPLNPIEIANQIERILTNEENIEKIINAAISEVSANYSWESQAENLLELYKTIR
ncbi:MAG: hypothetical protein RLZ33_1497 [Bacteroidota bacterium]|jgi:glycosyltransferase involved in cell wall biosynthesis